MEFTSFQAFLKFSRVPVFSRFRVYKRKATGIPRYDTAHTHAQPRIRPRLSQNYGQTNVTHMPRFQISTEPNILYFFSSQYASHRSLCSFKTRYNKQIFLRAQHVASYIWTQRESPQHLLRRRFTRVVTALLRGLSQTSKIAHEISKLHIPSSVFIHKKCIKVERFCINKISLSLFLFQTFSVPIGFLSSPATSAGTAHDCLLDRFWLTNSINN